MSTPLYQNSIVSNDLEFIRTSDHSAFSCLSYVGTQQAEMPDKRNDRLIAKGTFTFKANFHDGTSVGLWAHPDFGSRSAAMIFVNPIAQAIGKLPTLMRAKLDHVVVHKGNETAFAEADGLFFVLYSENVSTRVRNHDLEETVFHESVHATLDKKYLGSKQWARAQKADRGFITGYAASRPDKEDMAESALFAWTMLVHPGRLPENVEQRVREIMPSRLAFFKDLFLNKPLSYDIGPGKNC